MLTNEQHTKTILLKLWIKAIHLPN